MENEKENLDKPTLTEEISNIGQIIVGELESIGGIINANPNARAEGDLRADEGIIREKIQHDLTEEEPDQN